MHGAFLSMVNISAAPVAAVTRFPEGLMRALAKIGGGVRVGVFVILRLAG